MSLNYFVDIIAKGNVGWYLRSVRKLLPVWKTRSSENCWISFGMSGYISKQIPQRFRNHRFHIVSRNFGIIACTSMADHTSLLVYVVSATILYVSMNKNPDIFLLLLRPCSPLRKLISNWSAHKMQLLTEVCENLSNLRRVIIKQHFPVNREIFLWPRKWGKVHFTTRGGKVAMTQSCVCGFEVTRVAAAHITPEHCVEMPNAMSEGRTYRGSSDLAPARRRRCCLLYTSDAADE